MRGDKRIGRNILALGRTNERISQCIEGKERGGGGGRNSRQTGELSLSGIPHLDRINIGPDQFLQVGSQGSAIILETAASGRSHTLGDVEDDAREPFFVNVDLLVAGNLAKFTASINVSVASDFFPPLALPPSSKGDQPDVGKLVGQVADKRPAKERGASVSRHLILESRK